MTAYALIFEGHIFSCPRISPWSVCQIITSLYWWLLEKALRSPKKMAAKVVQCLNLFFKNYVILFFFFSMHKIGDIGSASTDKVGRTWLRYYFVEKHTIAIPVVRSPKQSQVAWRVRKKIACQIMICWRIKSCMCV